MTALAAASAADGALAVSGAADGSLALWRLDDNRSLGTIAGAHRGAVAAIAAARLPDGDMAVSAGRDGALLAWRSTADGLAAHRTLAPPGGAELTACRVGGEGGGAIVVTGDERGTIRVIDFATGTPLCAPLHGHGRSVTAVDAASRGGERLVVSASRDRTLRVWKPAEAALRAAA